MTPARITRDERVRRLAAPVPGRIFLIPLELLVDYYALHHIQPVRYADDILFCKKEEGHNDQRAKRTS